MILSLLNHVVLWLLSVYSFEIGFGDSGWLAHHCVAEASFKLALLLPDFPVCYRQMPLHTAVL